MSDFTQNFNRFAYCLNNPLIYTDPSGQSIVGDAFKWIKKNTWDAVWDGLNNFAQWADQNGIPAAGGGYNSAHGTYHYMGNSGNVYHNQFGNNYEGKVEQAVYTARQVAAQSSGAIYELNNINIVADKNGNLEAFPKGLPSGAVETVNWELTLLPAKALQGIYRVGKMFHNARSLVYNEGALTKTDFFHQFPRLLDRTITKEGKLSWENGGLWQTMPGTIQRKGYMYYGNYEIGTGIRGIYHRNFVPIKKVKMIGL